MNTEASDLFIGLPMGVPGPLALRLASGAQDGGPIRRHCDRVDAARRGTHGCHC